MAQQDSDAKAVRTAYNKAVKAARAAVTGYDLSELGYTNVVAALVAMEDIQHANGCKGSKDEAEFLEIFFPQPAHKSPPTISKLLLQAQKKHDVRGALENKNFYIQEALGYFIPPDNLSPPQTGSGNGFEKPAILSKVDDMISGLLKNGIYADDFRVLRGESPPSHWMRQEPYVIIEIPKLDVQIAICNEYGNTTFVSKKILSLNAWQTTGKIALKEMMAHVDYKEDGTWIDTVMDIVLQGDDGLQRDPATLAKVPLPKKLTKPLLTEEKVKEWITLFYDHELETTGVGRYPSTEDKIIWERDKDGKWTENSKESWRSTINSSLILGLRGLTKTSGFGAFKREHGFILDSTLTVEQVKIWIMLFYEHELEITGVGRYPSQRDKIIWERNEDGEWIENLNELWINIHASLSEGLRGLPKMSGLGDFKKQHGFDKTLTVEQIRIWLTLFYEHELETKGLGRYPSQLEKIVWERNQDGKWTENPEESWINISSSLSRGSRDLPKMSGLGAFKKEHGFTKDNPLMLVMPFVAPDNSR